MDKDRVMQAIEVALQSGDNDGMEVGIEGQKIGFTRFSNERITQNVSRSKDVLTVKVCFGRREGTARTTDFSPESLRSTVRTAEEIARHSEENLEHVPPLKPTPVPTFDAFFEKTERVGPFDRARMVKNVLARCETTGHTCAGLIGNGTLMRAFGNSEGHNGFFRKSWARMHCTVMTEDSSGWKRVTAEDIDKIDPETVFETALQKAENSQKPVEVEPGRYTVVLESPAVVDLLAFMLWLYNAKLAHEGRSFMTGRAGEKIADERVTIGSFPGHPKVPGYPFQTDGLPAVQTTWIRNGMAEKMFHDRFWAKKLGTEPSGVPGTMLMEGTDSPVEDLIARVDRGILVSRFWYVRYVDQMKLLVTGMTRDGTFLIENGQVTRGIKNLRWNDSILRVLNHLEAIGQQERQGEYVDALVPSLTINDFNFTSKTLF
ncbi:MAG: TldD/PmbA family protein [Planctomycetota bacterium]|jgi:predicted Zn-dependent protease